MKIVKFLSRVDPSKCNGDKRCESVCPTGAIRVINKTAEVDEKKCVACFKCGDACREEAVDFIPRPEPMVLGVDLEKVDQQKVQELCFKAYLHPDQPVCTCSGVLAKEIAAAVLLGAQTPEEVTLMTGARGGCGVYCISPVLSLLKAHGVRITPPKGHQWYDVTVHLFDTPEELARKYPTYCLKEDKEFFAQMQAQLQKPHC